MSEKSKAQASISNWVGISIVLAFVILLGVGVAMIFGGQSATIQSTTTSQVSVHPHRILMELSPVM